VGFIVAVIAQLVQTRFEIRLVLAQLKRRQYATIIGAVAAIIYFTRTGAGKDRAVGG
jgi:hypothetical protein